MLRCRIKRRLIERLSAAAIHAGHSVGTEINARLENSFARERAEPKEWR